MGKIKTPPKEKTVKYTDLEKYFKQIEKYLADISQNPNRTETKEDLKEYKEKFENLKKDIREISNYQSKIKLSKFEDTEFIEKLKTLKLETLNKSKTEQPKAAYKKVRKTFYKLENKIIPKTLSEKLQNIFWIIVAIILGYVVLKYIFLMLFVIFTMFFLIK
jgi:hypothetical protein